MRSISGWALLMTYVPNNVTFTLRVSAPANVCFRLQVNLNVKQGGKRLEHQGIRIEFVGQIGELSQFSPWLCVWLNPRDLVAKPPCLQIFE